MPLSLKLMLDPAVAEALQDAALFWQLSQPAPSQQHLTLHFFDTPEGALRQQGLRLCVWREDGHWQQALQADAELPLAPALWLGQRWETPLPGRRAQPDLATLLRRVGSAAPALAAPGLAQQLAPQARSRVRRSMQWQQLPEGEWVAWTLDQPLGASGRPARSGFCELRLHPRQPLEAPLLSLARHWLAALPAELWLYHGPACDTPTPGPVRARPLRLRRGMSLEQGLQAAADNGLAQLQANAAGVLASAEPECVHQMRVGLRRLRSAWQLLGVRLPPDLKDGLRWLAGLLGEARNAEVLAGETLPALGGCSPALAQAAQEQARLRRAEAAAGLASVRYAGLMLGLRAWNQQFGWRDHASARCLADWQTPVAAGLRPRLQHLLTRLRRRGRRPRQASPRRLHRARILAKRLRYSAEFCAGLLPPRRLRRFIDTLSQLQTHWGHQQDHAVAEALLRRLAGQHPALGEDCRLACLALLQREDPEAQKHTLRRAWRRLRRQTPPWRGRGGRSRP